MSNLTTELLSEFSIFNGLNVEQIKAFIPHIKTNLITQNENIINEGEDGDSLIFLFSRGFFFLAFEIMPLPNEDTALSQTLPNQSPCMALIYD